MVSHLLPPSFANQEAYRQRLHGVGAAQHLWIMAGQLETALWRSGAEAMQRGLASAAGEIRGLRGKVLRLAEPHDWEDSAADPAGDSLQSIVAAAFLEIFSHRRLEAGIRLVS